MRAPLALLLALAACGETPRPKPPTPLGAGQPLGPDGQRAMRLDDRTVLRRDWYGEEDVRPWIAAPAGTLVFGSEKGRCWPWSEGLSARRLKPRRALLALPAGPERPVRLQGDCAWVAPTVNALPPRSEDTPRGAAHLSARWGAEWVLRPPPGARLVGRASAPVRVELGERAHRLPAGAFELPLEPGRLVAVRARAEAGTAELALGLARSPAPSPPPRRVRHAIVLLADTLRADRLAVYAPETRARAPHLGALAREADVYERAYAPASWTKPSVASVLSSIYPWQHRVLTHHSALPAEVPLFTERLRHFGVETAAFVSNGYVSDRFGFERGWDRFVHSADTGRARAAEQVEDLLAWIDGRRDAERPFFAYLHTTDPHSPYEPPADVLARLDPEPYAGPIDFTDDPLLLRRIGRGEVPLSERDRARLTALYEGEVEGHDRALGALVEGLRARGLLDETLLIVTADHGEELFDHGDVGHGGGRVWEELIRVPMVMRWPGVSAGRRVATPASSIDVGPTVLEALGLPTVEYGSPSARSLRALVGHRGPRVVMFGRRDSLRGGVDGHLKLVRRRDGSVELWDLDADPGERAPREDALGRRWMLEGMAREMAANPTRGGERRRGVDGDLAAQLRALGYVGDE